MNLPYLIALNLTQRCNLTCDHCYMDATTRSSAKSGELTTEEYRELFREIALKAPGTLLVLTGGEPLLRQDIFDLIAAGNNEGLRMVLGTNGTLLDRQSAQKLAISGLEGAGISLESTTALEHDLFRGKSGAWQNSRAAIRYCQQVGLQVQIHTTVTKKNLTQLSEIVLFAQKQKVKLLNFFFLVCTGRGQYLNDLNPEQYEAALITIAQLQQTTKGVLIQVKCAPHFKRILYQIDPASKYTKVEGYEAGNCLAATHYCRINYQGDVTPCPYMEQVAGNIRSQSFWKIWESSDLFKRFQKPQLDGRCGRCEFDQLCGGCRARATTLMGEDPTCSWQPEGHPSININSLSPTPTKQLYWTPEAKKRLEKIPLFLRGMIRKHLEVAAEKQGTIITPRFMSQHRAKREVELGIKFRE